MTQSPAHTARCRRVAFGVIAALLVLASTAGGSEPLTDVDQIIALHIEARGGYENIKAIRTLVYSGGLYQEGDYRGSGNATMSFMRPYLRVVGNPEEPGDFK